MLCSRISATFQQLIIIYLLCLPTFFNIIASQQAGPSNRREEQSIRNVKAKEMLKYMDVTADPCKDFFDFACGNWPNYNKQDLNEGDVISSQTLLEDQVNKELQIILEEQLTPHDALSGRKIKDFYKSCITVEKKSSMQHAYLMNFLKRYGGLPLVPGTNWNVNYQWVHIIAMLRANFGLDILIGLEIDRNLHTMRGNSIYLAEPKETLIPVNLCSAVALQEITMNDEVYETIQKQVADNMKEWFNYNDADANRFAGDIVRFEFDLCKHMRKDQTSNEDQTDEVVRGERNDAKYKRNLKYRTGQSRLNGNRQAPYPRLTLQQLTQQFGGLIDFKVFVNLSLETSINDQVYMKSENYFKHLAHFIQRSAKTTLANYIIYRAFFVINFPNDDTVKTRPKYCVNLVRRYFPKVIGEVYSRKVYRSDTKKDIDIIFNGISRAFEHSLDADWLNENFRRAARQKHGQFKITFPTYHNLDLTDLQIERLDYWRKLELIMKYRVKREHERLSGNDYGNLFNNVEAPDVHMELLQNENEIYIGWGLLQMPLYHNLYPNSLKYSFLGQQMAREFVKGFDDQGWNQNPQNPMRWDEYTVEEYRKRHDCFETQLSNYLYNNPDSFRNATKLREIMTDSSGLNIAFKAYLNWLQSVEPTARNILMKETLPEINYTNTQLFFINFAQSRCSASYVDEPIPEYLPLDKRTSLRYNINGPLANFNEFSREFGCSSSTEMNLDDKCVIY